MKYTIAEVEKFSDQTYGKDANHLTVVRVNDGEGTQKCSAFLKTRPVIGDEWEGTIKEVDKDGKTYYNFVFDKKTSSSGGFTASASEVKNLIEFKVMPMLVEIRSLLKPQSAVDYPAMTDENDMSPF